ncbi:hypothetical protein [Streptomyces sp. Rer75]|uniref:hypothetical protein n=1 Tax=Streptomyces sp. Rer75 TaxID=2750011 RepID=UPI0015CFBC76|nr:hypothetical protein [Streptomyces sp. Rer75]QLH19325.1 hypothetical protein HYQ63_00300 [Streptomyces sp. Rer75]
MLSEGSRLPLSSWQSSGLVAWHVTLRLRAAILVVIVIWVTTTGFGHLPAWAVPLGAVAAAAGHSSVRYLRIRFL